MTLDPSLVEIARCEACLARFLPPEGPCPRCGAPRVVLFSVPDVGTVLAATELTVPPAGIPAPHRLGIVEIAEGVRLLVQCGPSLPDRGSTVRVRKDGDVYRLSPEPVVPG